MGIKAGLGTASTAANNAYKTNTESIAIIANNIANANNPDVSEKVPELKSINTSDGIGAGSVIDRISRKLDKNLIDSGIIQNSDLANKEIFVNYYGKIMDLFGKPDDPNSIIQEKISGSVSVMNNINDIFSSLTLLSNNPEIASAKIDVVNKLNMMTTNIKNIASGLNDLRYQADVQIKQSVDNVNSLLSQIYTTNKAIVTNSNIGANITDLEDSMEKLLHALSAELNIKFYTLPNGSVQISASNAMLIDSTGLYNLNYSPVASVETFSNYKSTGPLTVYKLNEDGSIDTKINKLTLITDGYGVMAGKDSTVSNILESGNIYALQQLRDVEIPTILDELDNFSNMLTLQFNAIHNSSTSYSTKSSFTGTRPVRSTDGREFSGQAMIAVVDPQGNPVLRPDGTYLPPLTLDFDKISTSVVSGEMSTQTIIDEINQYFFKNYIESRASLGNIYDIKLAASSDLSLLSGGTLSFNLELENNSNLNSNIQVIGVSVSGGANGLTSALPIDFTSYAGTRARSNGNFTLSFENGNGGPYNVGVTVQVTDEAGNISTGTINYLVNDNLGTTIVQNTRYAATSVTGSAVFNNSNAIKGVALASIVDSNGNSVEDGKSGFLQIRGLDDYAIVIDDLNSADNGIRAGSKYSTVKVPGTGKGFSGYFELNDLFARNPISQSGTTNPAILGTAKNLSIRSDIIQNPSLFSTSNLDRSVSIIKSSTKGLSTASATLVFSENPSLGDSITLYGQKFTFVALASSDDQITLGSNLPETLTNIINTVSLTNLYTSGTVNKAKFETDGSSKLKITHKNSGSAGNDYSISFNFQTAKLNLNSSDYFSSGESSLKGGSDQEITETITALTYQIAPGNKAAIDKYLRLESTNLNFFSAGSLPSQSVTIYNYFSSILGVFTTQYQDYVQQRDIQSSISESIKSKKHEINTEEQLTYALNIQNTLKVTGKLMNIINNMFDTILSVLN